MEVEETKTLNFENQKFEPSMLEQQSSQSYKALYSQLKGVVQNGRGLKSIVEAADDQKRVIQKLKNKHFMLAKNDVKRNKRRVKTRNSVIQRKRIKEKNLYMLRNVNWNIALKMNEIWNEYANELVPSKAERKELNEATFLTILRGDFHGARIKVVSSKVESLVGVEGIVLKEGLRTLCVITEQGKRKTLLKKDSIFQVKINGRILNLLGVAMEYRQDERSRIKYKNRNFVPKIQKIISFDS